MVAGNSETVWGNTTHAFRQRNPTEPGRNGRRQKSGYLWLLSGVDSKEAPKNGSEITRPKIGIQPLSILFRLAAGGKFPLFPPAPSFPLSFLGRVARKDICFFLLWPLVVTRKGRHKSGQMGASKNGSEITSSPAEHNPYPSFSPRSRGKFFAFSPCAIFPPFIFGSGGQGRYVILVFVATCGN